MADEQDWRARERNYLQRGWKFVSARFDPKSHLGLGLTTRLVLCALAIWAFSGLLDAVLDNETLVRIDRIIAAWFTAHDTPTGRTIFNIITQLGSPVVWVLMAIGAIYLWFAHEHALLVSWIAANLGGKALEYVIKNTVHRTRPEYSAAYLHGQSYSFPSGHAMGSTICYLMTAYIIAARPEVSRRTGIVAHVVAIAIIATVAFSRLYLVVHYLSDVLGGVAAGLAWLSLCGTARHVVVGTRQATARGKKAVSV
jgi:undecaprenyl-diphosphatase